MTHPSDWLSEIEARAAKVTPVGCGDHSCYFQKPTGQGTNGGCRCFSANGFSGSMIAAAFEMLPEIIQSRTDIVELCARLRRAIYFLRAADSYFMDIADELEASMPKGGG